MTETRTGNDAERCDHHDALLRFATAHALTTAAAIVDALRSLLEGLGAGVADDAAALAVGVPPAMPRSR